MGKFKILAVMAFYVALFFLVSGCSTLRTEKGREERDYNLNYKRLFVADAGIKAYYNCRKAGGSRGFCQERYGIFDDAEGNFLPDAEGWHRSAYLPSSAGDNVSQSANRVERSVIPPVEKRRYLNIGGDPVNKNRKLAPDESPGFIPYDTEVVLEGRHKNSTGWVRGGTQAVYGPDGKLRWIRACGNAVLKILREAKPLPEQTPAVVAKREEENKSVYNPPFQFLPMPHLEYAYLDAPKGTWQGNLWDMLHFNLGAELIYHMGLPDTNISTSVSPATGVATSVQVPVSGGGSGGTASSPSTTTSTTYSSSGYSSNNQTTVYQQLPSGQTTAVVPGGPVGAVASGVPVGAPAGAGAQVIFTTPSAGTAVGASGGGGGSGGIGSGGPSGGAP